ncbi:MAG: polyphenol oxidase family protein [Actinomycetota bacterium]
MRFRRLPAGPGTAVELCLTDRHDGDFRIDAPADQLTERRRAVFDGEWTWLRQVHGHDVAMVESPGAHAGTDGDAAVTGLLGAVVCVQTADCVPIVVVSDHAVGVIHAGWRGLVSGVVDRAVDAVRSTGSGPLQAVIGPCIRPAHYEFGSAELDQVEAAVGGPCRGETVAGTLALDMATATTHALHRAGVEYIDDLGFDTADERFFSHRVRGDVGRQITAARLVTA